MRVETQNIANSYTADLVLTGTPIGTDAAPTNLASVAAARRIAIRPGIFMSAGTAINAFALDGSSTIVGRFWWYEASVDLWIPNGAGLTLTTATTNSGVNTHGAMPGALWHFQVTANAGGTTKVAIVIK